MNQLYVGLPLSGKTSKLKQHYVSLAGTMSTDRILVLLEDSRQVSLWRSGLDLPVSSSLQMWTYWGFIQSEIKRYWNWVEDNVFEGTPTPRPVFINAEAAHYLMTTIVRNSRTLGMFDALVATPAQIALQVIKNLNIAATSGVGIDETFARLLKFMGSGTDRLSAISDAQTVAKEFREICKKSHLIDYSMSVEIYSNILMKQERYRNTLKDRFSVLIADNLEESVPAEVDLISFLLNSVEEAYGAFDPTGGHMKYFGADPEYAWKTLAPRFEISRCDKTYGCKAEEFASTVYKNIKSQGVIKKSNVAPGIFTISTEYRSEAISEMVKRISYLVNDGCQLSEIVVVAPVIDYVLEKTLSTQLENMGIALETLNRKQILADEELARVMVTLAVIIDNYELSSIPAGELARTFSLILEIDPIRSRILADFCWEKGMGPLPAEVITRIGFAANERYQDFYKWVTNKRKMGVDENNLFQQMFAEMIVPLIHSYEDIITSRQIIKSAIGFKKIYDSVDSLSGKMFLPSFTDMINQGTVSSDAIRMREVNPEAVVLATPIALFKSSRSFAHQFWLDCSSDIWFRSGVRELENIYILAKSWDGIWNDEKEIAVKAINAARTVAGMIYRCRESITMLVSEYNGLGQEMEGILHEIVAGSVVSG